MKSIVAIITLLLIGVTAYGQKFVGASYSIAAPVGNTPDYIDQIGLRGFEIEGRHFLTDRVSLGGSLGWQAFYESGGEQTTMGDDFALLGRQWRYINRFPVLLTAHFYTKATNNVRFYGGSGAGAVYNIQRTDIGIYTFEDSAWNFGLAPEVEILVPFKMRGNIHFALQYWQSFGGGEIDDDLGALALKIGFVIM
jgi:hypothetical protein